MSASGRCAGCAFTPGTDAHDSPLTLPKAEMCARARVPFLCHESPEDARTTCAGYREAVAQLRADGYFERQTADDREALRGRLEGLEAVETACALGALDPDEARHLGRNLPSPRGLARYLGRRFDDRVAVLGADGRLLTGSN